MFVHGILDRTRSRWPDAEAIRDATGSWTYAQLDQASRDAARWLASQGVGSGARVVVRAHADRRVVALFYACSRLGAAFVPVPSTVTPYQLAHVVGDAAPVLAVGDGSFACPAHTLAEPFESTARDNPTERPTPERTRPVLFFYTSGSTATPKAVVCTHDQVCFAARAIAGRLAYRSDDVVFCRLPLSFDYGFYQVLLTALAGATVVVADSTADVRLPAELLHHGATIVPLVPALAEMLTRLAPRSSRVPRIRLFTNTGEQLPAAVVNRLRHHFPGAGIQLMFGLTECKRVTIGDVDGDRAKPGSVGTALPGTRVYIVDEHGAPVPPGTAGEIVVSGPHVMAGYWRAPELTRQVFRTLPDGTAALFTGDMGHLDEDRHLYFHGRRDQVFKRRGVRTSVQEIEAAALDIPGVHEAVMVPPNGDRDAELIVVTELTAVESLRRLRERLEAAKVPDRCRVVPHLPRTPNGKIDRSAISAGHAE